MSGSAVAAEAETVESDSLNLADITGVWVGTYTCAQGETGLELTVEDSGRTEFAFHPLANNPEAKSGKYEMRASVQGEKVEFDQVRWIERPGDYGMVDLVATRVQPSTMRGNVSAAGCTTFQVERKRN